MLPSSLLVLLVRVSVNSALLCEPGVFASVTQNHAEYHRLGQCVVSQRRLIAQHAAWSNVCRTSDMTTAPDDSSGYLCGGSYPRVRPDDRTFNARTFLDETALAQYRVDDLRAGFDLTIVANHR